MSETQADVPIDELLADFLVKKISKKAKKKKYHKKSKSKHKSRSSSKSEDELEEFQSDESAKTDTSSDSARSLKKSHHRHRRRSHSREDLSERRKSSKRKHKKDKHSRSHSSKSPMKRHKHKRSNSHDSRNERTWGKERGSDAEKGKRVCNFEDDSVKTEEKEIKQVLNIHDHKDSDASSKKTSHVVAKLDCSSNNKSELSVKGNFSSPSKDINEHISNSSSKDKNINFKIDLDVSAVVKEVMSDVMTKKGQTMTDDQKGTKQTNNWSDSSEKSAAVNLTKDSSVLSDFHADKNEDINKLSMSGNYNQIVDLKNSKDKKHKLPFQQKDEVFPKKRKEKDENNEGLFKRKRERGEKDEGFSKRKKVKDKELSKRKKDERDSGKSFEKWEKCEGEHENEVHGNEKSSNRSSSKERRDERKKSSEKEKIDKARLLEIARRNVLSMIEKGTLPQGMEVSVLKKEALVTIKSGGNSVEELTEFCRTLSEKERKDEENADDGFPSEVNHDENEQPFIHHPFKLKESFIIKMNIKNSVPLPIKTHAEKVTENARSLSLQFPVSSGNQHRQKEYEWVPVEKKTKVELIRNAESSIVSLPRQTEKLPANAPRPPLLAFPPVPATPPLPPSLPPPPPPPDDIPCSVFNSFGQMNFTAKSSPSLLPSPPQVTPAQLNIVMPSPSSFSNSSYSPASTDVFKNMKKPINLQEIVTQRFKAMQKLQENPYDLEATKCIQEAQMKMQKWVESQQVPGQFTGSTNAKLLRPDELCGPRPVWAKKDIFSKAAPVTGGKGMSLLRKMGWNPGEGLGKNKEGTLEPLLLNIKMDKKGLVAAADKKLKIMPSIVDGKNNIMIEGKHPVSMLMELCSKKKWPPPAYSEVALEGPPYKKQFLYKVQVNGTEYQPATPRNIKKLAKADAATCCLKAVGFLPANYGS